MSPTTNKKLMQRVEDALESMRPFLRADGGDVELVDIDANGYVTIRLLGQCSNCSMSRMTMKAGIEAGIFRAAPEIKKVIALLEVNP